MAKTIEGRVNLSKKYRGIEARLAKPKRAEAQTLDGVLFASSRAETVAIEIGLNISRFKGQRPTGATGFTVADVRRIAGE